MLNSRDQPFPQESKNIEYKEKWTPEIKKEIGAFLNNSLINGISRSYIYLGVNDNTRRITHYFSSKEKHLFEERISHWAVNDFYPPAFSQIKVYTDRTPFCIEVDSVPDKVFNTKANISAHYGIMPTYIRSGSSSLPIGIVELRTMLLKSSPIYYDTRMSPWQHLTFNYLRKKLIRNHLSLNLKKIDNFFTLSGKYSITALVLSDMNPMITRLGVHNSNKISNNFLTMKTFTGSILRQIDEAWTFLKVNIHTRSIISGLTRYDVRDYPLTAVREILINAFAHRSYININSINRIDVFPQKMWISSPGEIPRTINIKEILQGCSQPRNPDILHVLKLLRYAEHYGNGWPLVLESYKGFPLINQKIKLLSKNKMVRVSLPNVNFKYKKYYQPMNKKTYLSRKVPFVQSKRRIITYLHQYHKVTHLDIEQICHIHSAMASRILLKMRKLNLLTKHGKRRGTYYTLK